MAWVQVGILVRMEGEQRQWRPSKTLVLPPPGVQVAKVFILVISRDVLELCDEDIFQNEHHNVHCTVMVRTRLQSVLLSHECSTY